MDYSSEKCPIRATKYGFYYVIILSIILFSAWHLNLESRFELEYSWLMLISQQIVSAVIHANDLFTEKKKMQSASTQKGCNENDALI